VRIDRVGLALAAALFAAGLLALEDQLGARPADIGQTGEESWHVIADPEGNEFCLLKARLNPL
jgi:Glyoxalase-like domain